MFMFSPAEEINYVKTLLCLHVLLALFNTISHYFAAANPVCCLDTYCVLKTSIQQRFGL